MTYKSIFQSKALAVSCVLAAFCLVFLACNKSNDPAPSTPVAALMAFNLSPDKSSIGIRLSGSNLTPAPLSYGSYTGGYVSVYPGTVAIEAYDNSGTFSSSQATLDSLKYYSIFVIGMGNAHQNLLVNDRFDGLTPSSGIAYLRFVNAISDSVAPTITVQAGGNNVINTTAQYGIFSNFVSVPAGKTDVVLNNAQDINTSRTLLLEEKKVYTVLLIGNTAATDTTLKPQIRLAQNGNL